VRFATLAAAIVLIASACGGGHPANPFSVSQTIATFRAHQLSIGRYQNTGCPEHPPTKLITAAARGACSTITISTAKGERTPHPIATLIPSSPSSPFELFVYATTAEVSRMSAHGLLHTTTDPLFGRRLNYLHRANVVVMCAQCSKGTLHRLSEALGDL